MTAVPRVLLVGHDASRTGAPAVAEQLVRWAVTTGAAELRVALLAGGPRAVGLGALAPTTVATDAERLLARAVGPTAHAPRLRRAAGAFDRPPIVVANTLAAWAAAATVARRRALVCWVHELDGVADALVPPGDRAALVAQTDRFLAAGGRVASMLVERWGVPADRVVALEPFVDDPTGHRAHPSVRVLGAGALVARKGADLFVSILASSAAGPALGPSGAVWAGGPVTSAYADLVRADRRAAGLDPVLELAGPTEGLDGWWPADGVLLHPAREDPDPLVVTEAARRGVPVATWDTGGAADLLRSAGLDHLVAPAGDQLALARILDHLLAEADQRRAAGRALMAAAAGRTVAVGAPRALAEIEAASS